MLALLNDLFRIERKPQELNQVLKDEFNITSLKVKEENNMAGISEFWISRGEARGEERAAKRYESELAERDAAIAARDVSIAAQANRIAQLEAQLAALQA